MNRETARANIDNFNYIFKITDNTNASFTEYMANISSELDIMFQTATPTEIDVDITTPAGTLDIPITNNMANSIAVTISDYWSKTIETSGTPVDRDSIDSVTNTAIDIIPLIENRLLAITTGIYSLSNFQEFIDVVADAVSTIMWTVSESGADGCSSTLSVNGI